MKPYKFESHSTYKQDQRAPYVCKLDIDEGFINRTYYPLVISPIGGGNFKFTGEFQFKDYEIIEIDDGTGPVVYNISDSERVALGSPNEAKVIDAIWTLLTALKGPQIVELEQEISEKDAKTHELTGQLEERTNKTIDDRLRALRTKCQNSVLDIANLIQKVESDIADMNNLSGSLNHLLEEGDN